ncbi:hypothetical protein ACFTXJ_25390 [Streptomyces zhihengii]|uniref:hypothetical protein n=1 Tax=Streptomyces zhihengii TaxID=1818004 RepID=UPI00364583AE
MKTMMLSQSFGHGVLVITIHDEPAREERAETARRLADLMCAHRPAPVVVVMADAASTAATAEVVRQAHRRCGNPGVLLSVATHSAPVRRLLEAEETTVRHRMGVHPHFDTAFSSASRAHADLAGTARTADPSRTEGRRTWMSRRHERRSAPRAA